MTINFKCFFLCCLPFFAFGQTYTMTAEQLYLQLHNATPVEVVTIFKGSVPDSKGRFALGRSQKYMSNGVKEIVCAGKNGEVVRLANSPRIEVVIKDKNGKRHEFYFDTINLNDSTFSGIFARAFPKTTSIHYNNIETIKLRDGHKYYAYWDGKIPVFKDDE